MGDGFGRGGHGLRGGVHVHTETCRDPLVHVLAAVDDILHRGLDSADRLLNECLDARLEAFLHAFVVFDLGLVVLVERLPDLHNCLACARNCGLHFGVKLAHGLI